MTIQFSQKQGECLRAISAWFDQWTNFEDAGDDRPVPQVMRVFGFAGSGKTTLASEFAQPLGRGVLAATFTGKAALVMRKKGFNCSTIHSLIYKVKEVDKLDKDGELTGEMELDFVLDDESALATAKLLIIDEVSMVGRELAEDLLSFGVPILVLGDPGQLPPIEGTGYFTQAKPDVMLTEIHRQALDNPIIRMSMDIRQGKGVRQGAYGESKVIPKALLNRAVDLNAADQVLCGLNRTRTAINLQMRGYLGFNQPGVPMVGEKLICLRNNRKKGFFNGGMWKVRDEPVLDGEFAEIQLDSIDIEGQAQKAKVPLEFFRGEAEKLLQSKRRKGDEFDYGYAITVHKSQGSQWNNVLVFNENYCFRENAIQWLYTAVTRAAEKLTLVV